MYLFLKPAPEFVLDVSKKFEYHQRFLTSHSLYQKWWNAYFAYYNEYSVLGRGATVGTMGEQGEFAGMAVNHLRNIVKHILVMATQNKVVFDPLAINSDIASRNAVKITDSVLEYYLYEKKFQQQIQSALELSLVMGSSFLGVFWNPRDEIVAVDGEGAPVYRGAPNMQYFSVYDVILDTYKDDWNKHDWVITREIANRWDLMALYPEMAKEIENLPRITQLNTVVGMREEDENAVWLYKSYHKQTPALPQGRMTIFCEGHVTLEDGPSPYPGLPIIPCIPDKRYGMIYGHAVTFDLLPIQESLNFIHSTILSNQQAFGTQNIAVPADAAIQDDQLDGGLKILHFRVVEGAPNGGAPFPLELCKTPSEIFTYQDMQVKSMEMVSGVNSAARGNPSSNLSSGTAIALTNTAAQVFNSSVERAYTDLSEQAATYLIKLLQKYLPEDEIIEIAGKINSYSVKSFMRQDLSPIQRVRAQTGSALSKTLAGKMEIANQLLGQGMLKPDQYLEVLRSGQLSAVVDTETTEHSLIQTENDMMLDGVNPPMSWTDNHVEHMEQHKKLLSLMHVRQDQAMSQVVLQHIQEHVDQLEQMSMGAPLQMALSLDQPIPLPQAALPMEGSQAPAAPSTGQMSPEQMAQIDGTQTAEDAAQPTGMAAVAAAGERAAQKVQAKASGQA